MSEALRAIPSPPGFGTRAAQRLVLRALDHVEGGTIEIGSQRFGSGPPVRVEVVSRDLYRRLLWRPRMGLGESYAAGDWTADDLPRLFETLIRSVDAWRSRSFFARTERYRPHVSPRQSLHRARSNIGYHYDLGNDLYELFLDETLTYSCGLWEEGDTLADAQHRKLRRVADLLELEPGDRVLEIGCGWGSFAVEAAGRGAEVTGLTLSTEQAATARERGVDVRLEDYRVHEGSYTKVASIEMLEAIGHAQYPTYFQAIDRLLEPGGRAVIQVIAMPDDRYERYRRHDDWIRRYIFPGSLLPSVAALKKALPGTSLRLAEVHDIGPDYAPTLQAWRERFMSRLDDVRRLGYGERFIRTWEFYLAYCEAAFRTESIRDVHLVFERK